MQRLPPGSGRERQTLRKLEKVAFCHFFDTLWRRLHPRLHRLPSKNPPSLFEDFHIPLAVCARLAAHRVPNPLNPSRLHRLPSKSPLRFLRIFISLLRFAHGWPRTVSRIP